MPLQHEFIADPESPAHDRRTYALKIAARDKENKGRKELVKYRRASEWATHTAIEAGSVSGLPGVRALRLWYACGPDLKCLPVDKVNKVNNRNLDAIFLASATETGRLLVSSCIGYDQSRSVVIPQKLWGPYNNEPVADDALMYDFKTTTQIGDIALLVPKHLRRAERHEIDPERVVSPSDVDLPLAVLLESLPESTY